MASLTVMPDIHICGGDILNEKFILTAAHCIKKLFAFLLKVKVGIHNTLNKTSKEQVYGVKKIHSLKLINSCEPGDIAILELKKDITFIDGIIEKGCFNLDKRDYPDQLLATGWGETEKMHKGLDNNENDFGVFDSRNYNLKQAFFNQIKPCEDFLICLKAVKNGDSVCFGVSGGPLHYTENGVTKVEGVFSFVTGTKKINNKDYNCIGRASYSRLSYYADWISETAGFNFCGAKEKN